MFLVWSCCRFEEVLDFSGLLDLGDVGLSITWLWKVQGSMPLYKRVDRALACGNWRALFPEAYVENLCHLHSDHCPILIHCGGQNMSRGERPFRF